ncbi:hypothetical protein F511_40165 [Dorcoceras hygrometricum]|uniref:Dystroglycan-like n=1 Tax=Dorcoceras hygrometricum TaxID=472368 RepID=A0A2Z7A201_9LAMI|nr:hypothetical protein F511_40165 [Dorcoceras hygrometricum]
MASSLIENAIQINFDSVLGISDNDGMVNMFKALEASGLRGFLGCPSTLYERELDQFLDTAIVQEGDITCSVSGKYVAISESRFVGVFGLPTKGLTDISAVPKDLVYDARSIFSQSGEPVSFSCKKRLLKYEYLLLNDILAKSLTVKAGSFDAVTHERFLMMTAIHFGIKVNWSKILFEVLKDMVDKTIKRAKGFATQICVLLKGDPAVTLGDAMTFPQQKILSANTVSTYVATNKTIDSRGETVEPVTNIGEQMVQRSDEKESRIVGSAEDLTTLDFLVFTNEDERLIETDSDTEDMETDQNPKPLIIEEQRIETSMVQRSDEKESRIVGSAEDLTTLDFLVFTNEDERLIETDSDTEDMETDQNPKPLKSGENDETSGFLHPKSALATYILEEPIEETEQNQGTKIADCWWIRIRPPACYLADTCAWLQPVFQEPGASRLIAVVTSIRSTTRFETPSSDCTRSPDEISTIGSSTKKLGRNEIPAKLGGGGGGGGRERRGRGGAR